MHSYHPSHLCPTGNEYNKPDVTNVYGSLQSAQALLLPACIPRKQHWLKIKRKETLQVLMQSAFSTKPKLLQHPKESAVQLESKRLHYLVQNNLSNRRVNCHPPEQSLSSQHDSSQLLSIKMRKRDESISECNKVKIIGTCWRGRGEHSTRYRSRPTSFTRPS